MRTCERCRNKLATNVTMTVVAKQPPKTVGSRTITGSHTTNLWFDLCPMCIRDLRLAFGKMNVEIEETKQ